MKHIVSLEKEFELIYAEAAKVLDISIDEILEMFRIIQFMNI